MIEKKEGYGVRSCNNCNNDFSPFQWNQKRCYECLEKLDPKFKGRPVRDCQWCGQAFQPRTVRQMNCSSECGERVRVDNYYIRTYGISREQYENMLDSSGHKCQICGGEGFLMKGTTHKAKLVVDHCHETGRIRGVLCHNCNRALGLLGDSIENLHSAVDYLSGSDQ